jgi:hypothetical protein
MRIWYVKKLLKFLNANFEFSTANGSTIWVMKDKVVAMWDNDGLEILWDIFKEGVLKP